MSYAYFPEEVEEKIVKEHLVNLPQLVSFSGVCRSWRSTAHRRNICCSFLGILVSKTSCPEVYCKKHDCNCVYCRIGQQNLCCHRTISSAPQYQFRPISTFFNSVTPPLPRSSHVFRTRRWMHEEEEEEIDLEKCHVMASNDGWLVLVHHPDRDSFMVRIFLLNPITGASIRIPPLSYCGDFKSYVMLSSSPDKHQDCHLFVVSSWTTPQLAWCNVSGGGWKYCRKDSKLFDVIVWSACYIGGTLYVVDKQSVHVFDNLINVTEEDEVDLHPPRSFPLPVLANIPSSSWKCYHATELNCQLIIVVRCPYVKSLNFKVYKLVSTTNGQDASNCWTEVRSLDGHAVFLGTHQCFCLPVAGNNGMIRGDHIYYLKSSCGQCEIKCVHYFYKDHFEFWSSNSRDCVVFNLQDRKLVEHFRLPRNNYYEDYTWFLPMPWDIHKHLNKKKKKCDEIDDNGFKLCCSSKVTGHNRSPQQLASTPCHKSFGALSLDD
ncbi:hypothetical protein LINGRAHAP2_LOCUS13462 [Linum grandiflorum]